MNEVINLLKSHRSIRKYLDRKIEESKVVAIIEAAQSASTSSFIQAYTIIRIEDQKKRKELARLAGEQEYVEKCPLFLVFCADLNRHKITCEMNNTNLAEGYTESFITATVDTALAAQNAMIAAESLGLGGVYIGGIRNNPSEVCKLLNIPKNVYPVFGMCLGYPDDDPGTKPRLPLDIILKKDKYNTDGDIDRLEEYDRTISQYYKERTGGKRDDIWTGQMAKLMEKPRREHMKEFLRAQGFKMK